MPKKAFREKEVRKPGRQPEPRRCRSNWCGASTGRLGTTQMLNNVVKPQHQELFAKYQFYKKRSIGPDYLLLRPATTFFICSSNSGYFCLKPSKSDLASR